MVSPWSVTTSSFCVWLVTATANWWFQYPDITTYKPITSWVEWWCQCIGMWLLKPLIGVQGWVWYILLFFLHTCRSFILSAVVICHCRLSLLKAMYTVANKFSYGPGAFKIKPEATLQEGLQFSYCFVSAADLQSHISMVTDCKQILCSLILHSYFLGKQKKRLTGV